MQMPLFFKPPHQFLIATLPSNFLFCRLFPKIARCSTSPLVLASHAGLVKHAPEFLYRVQRCPQVANPFWMWIALGSLLVNGVVALFWRREAPRHSLPEQYYSMGFHSSWAMTATAEGIPDTSSCAPVLHGGRAWVVGSVGMIASHVPGRVRITGAEPEVEVVEEAAKEVSEDADEEPDDMAEDEEEGTPEPTEVQKLEKALAEAIEAKTEAEKKVLYALAEAETVRRRSKTQIEDAKQFGVEKFARDILEVSWTMAPACLFVSI